MNIKKSITKSFTKIINFNSCQNLNDLKKSEHQLKFQVNKQLQSQYHDQGYLILNNIIEEKLALLLASKVESLFKGEFQTGNFPDEWTWRHQLDKQNQQLYTREIVNVWKSDYDFAKVVLSEEIGRFVGQLMGWEGTRIAQDDLWWKPPNGTKHVSFHQDSTYFTSISPNDIATLWIALDDTKTESGTLEYVPYSHTWKLTHVIPKDFFSPDNYKEALLNASKQNGVHSPEIKQVIVKKGGGSIHHGHLYHGSGINMTNDIHRRSLAIHFTRSDTKFSDSVNYIYGRYKLFNSKEMIEDFFPITYTKSGYVSPFIKDYLQKK